MERELHVAERPIPDLMTASGPGGMVLASIHPEPLRDAMRAQRGSIIERMAALPEPNPPLESTLTHAISERVQALNDLVETVRKLEYGKRRIGRVGRRRAGGDHDGLALAPLAAAGDCQYVGPDDPEKLAQVKDPHVAMALRLEAAFGLRGEEAIKFTPARDDRGACIRLKGSTTKGGRPREVPVRNDAQRALLDEARRLVGSGASIPPERNYRQQLKVYESQTREAGLYRMHGFRYALTRYEEIIGWKAPAAGGPPRRTLTGAKRRIDTAARRAIAEELGHARLGVAGVGS